MKKQTIELTGVILVDIMIILLPLYIGINQSLVDTVGYILTVFISLVVLIVLLTTKSGNMYETLLSKRKHRPNWWIPYDVLTDVLAAITWWSAGWESLALLLISEKLIIAIRWPEYFLPNKKD